jgi:site-specific recombinase XerC
VTSNEVTLTLTSGLADGGAMDLPPTLQPLVTLYIADGNRTGRWGAKSARGVSYRLSNFGVVFGQRPINQLTRHAVDRWLGNISNLAPGTRRIHLSAVRCFCRWLVDNGHIATNPTKGLTIRTPRAVPRALAMDKVERLLRVLPDARARAIVMLMLHCGVRCVELSRAEVEDYDPRNATILLHGKGGHERVLPIPGDARRALDGYLVERSVVSGPLFPSCFNPSAPIGAARISTLLGEWIRDAGIKRARFDGVAAHALRHTAASDVYDATHDLQAVQEMLGHASLATTQIYMRRANLDRLRTAMEGRDYRHAA